MSLRGGYHIIDLKNKPFSSTDETEYIYKDMYKNLLNSNAKFIMLSGLNYDGVAYADREAVFYEIGNGFQAQLKRVWNTVNRTYTDYFINILDDDSVSVTQDTIVYREQYLQSIEQPYSQDNAPTAQAVVTYISDQNIPFSTNLSLSPAETGIAVGGYITFSANSNDSTRRFNGVVKGYCSVNESGSYSLVSQAFDIPELYHKIFADDNTFTVWGVMFETPLTAHPTDVTMVPTSVKLEFTFSNNGTKLNVSVTDIPYSYDTDFKIIF